MIDLDHFATVDLTRPYTAGMSGFDRQSLKTIDKDGWNASQLLFYSHAGTHIDAPIHFAVNEHTIDSYPPERFISKVQIVDIPIHSSQQLLTVHDLKEVADNFIAGESLILRTHWNQYYGLPKFRDELPRVSKELAQWCVNQEVNILGVEPPSVADVNNLTEVTEIHQILLAGNVMIAEGLTNTEALPNGACILIVSPLLIKGGDGAPARILALVEHKN